VKRPSYIERSLRFFPALLLVLGLIASICPSEALASPVVGAPITITVGDNSTATLVNAINQINSNSPYGGVIDLSPISGQTISLNANLPTFTQGVTFLNGGSNVVIDGGNSYQVFNSNGGTIVPTGVQIVDGSLTGEGNVSIHNPLQVNGSSSSGNPVSLTSTTLAVTGSTLTLTGGTGTPNGGAGGSANLNVSGDLSVDPSNVNLTGGDGADNNSGDAGAGAAATATVGSLELTGGSTYTVTGGNGGHATGATGNAGQGGDAIFTSTGAVSIDASTMTLNGGSGGQDDQTTAGMGGNGGQASYTADSLNVVNGSNLSVNGGGGQYSNNPSLISGSGGDAILSVSNAVSVDNSTVNVTGGPGSFTDSASGGNGGNASVSVGSLTLYDNAGSSTLNITGGSAGYTNAGNEIGGISGSVTLTVANTLLMDGSNLNVTGGGTGYGNGADSSVTEGAGGNAVVSTGTLTMTALNGTPSVININGGTGLSDYGLANGGNGGDADLSAVGSVSVDSSNGSLTGGTGGTSSSANGGNGGNANFSSGSFTLTSSTSNVSSLHLAGGSGAGNNNSAPGLSGSGGSATLSSGAVSVDSSNVYVLGASGGTGYGTAGATETSGGNAEVTVGSLSLTSNAHGADNTIGSISNFQVQGGYGSNDNGSANAGNGGNAGLSASGAVSVDSSSLYVTGQLGGYAQGGNGGNGGNGGSASVSADSLVLTTSNNSQYASLNLKGGDGGNNTGPTAGLGGNGGSATLMVAGAVSVDSSIAEVYGGSAGSGFGSAGTTDATGGNAWVSMGSLTMTSNNYSLNSLGTETLIQVEGGTGSNDEALATGGTGGSAFLGTGNLSLNDSVLEVIGGTGGSSWSGGNGYSPYGSSSNTSYLAGNGSDNGTSEMGGQGGNTSFEAQSVTVSSNSTFEAYSNTGGSGGWSGNGGTASSGWNLNHITLIGGNGGNDNLGGTGGQGGDLGVTIGSLGFSGTNPQLFGGNGGGGGNAGTGGYAYSGWYIQNGNVTGGDGGDGNVGGTGGTGGDMALSITSIDMNSGASLNPHAGNGGTGGDAGTGGFVQSGFYNQSVRLQAGNGGNDNTGGMGGNGGSASAQIGTLSLNQSYASWSGGSGGAGGNAGIGGYAISGLSCTIVSDLAANGGDNNTGGAGGKGGDLSLTAGSVTLLNGSSLSFNGGTGGAGGTAGTGGYAVAESTSSLPYTTSNSVTAFGGNGGSDNTGGQGGNGGNVTASLGAVTEDGSSIYLAGGSGGQGGSAGGAGYGALGSPTINSLAVSGVDGTGNVMGNGGNGGNASLTVVSANLNNSSSIQLYGGSYGSGAVNGNGGNASVSIGSLTLADSNSYLNVTGGSGVTEGTAAATIGTLNGAGYMNINGNGTSTLQIANGNFSGNINGNESLNVAGGGALTLSGSNNFSGATTVTGSNSTLNIQDAGNINNQGLVLDGGTLQAGGSGLYLGNGVTVTGNGGTFDTNGVGSNLAGGISGAGGFGVTSSTGSGALTLSVDSTYTGATTVSGGALLNIQDAGGISSAGLVLNNGTLQAGGALSLSNSVTLASGGGTFDTNGNDSSLSGNITGPGTLVKAGSGALTISGNDGFGGLTVEDGSLVTGANWVLPSLGPVSIASTGVLDLNNYVQQVGVLTGSGGISMGSGNLNINNQNTGSLFSGNISGTGYLYDFGTAPLTLTGDNTYSGGTLLAGCTLDITNDTNWGTGAVTWNGSGTIQLLGSFSTSKNFATGGNAAIFDTNGYSLTITGNILEGNNNGSVMKNGLGTLTLSGDNTYNDGTTLAEGTLSLANDNALGTGGLTMDAGTTLKAGIANLAVTNAVALNGLDTLNAGGVTSTFSGVISGTGTLAVNTASGYWYGGVVTLTGNNTYSGGTTIESGTIAVTSVSALGSGSVTNYNGALDFLGNANAGSISITDLYYNSQLNFENASSAGNAWVWNTHGEVTFNGTSTAGNAWIYSGANSSVLFYGNSSAGAATLDTNNSDELDFLNNSNAGSAAIQNLGNSLVYFEDASSAYNASITNSSNSYIYFQGDNAVTFSTAGNSNISNNGTLDFENYSAAGAATLTTNTGGHTNFYNEATGGTARLILNGGTLDISEEAAGLSVTVGSLEGSGSVSLGANDLAIGSNGLNTGFIGNIANGGINGGTGGSLTKVGSGALTLSGVDTYSGGTTISAGTLNLGGNSALGTGNLTMLNGSTLQAGVNNLAVTNNLFLFGLDTFDTNGNNMVLSGVVADAPFITSLTKIGAGALTLTGDNTYNATNINAGTLVAANPNALGTGNVAVNGGTLQMSGPMTLNIGGNYTQGVSGTLQLGLGPTGVQGDTLNISGAATLAGTLRLVPYGGYLIHDTEAFTILNAASVTGTFSPVTNLVGGGSVSMVYDSTDVIVDELPNAPSFGALGTTPNEKNIGAALDYLAGHGGDPALIAYLNSQSNGSISGIEGLISPADLTPLYRMGFTTAEIEGGMVGQRLAELLGDSGFGSSDVSWNGEGPRFAGNLPASDEAAMSKDLEPQRWGGFASGLGNFGTVTGDSNAPGYQFSTGGMVAGLDYRFSQQFAAGLILGYSQSGSSQSTGTVNATGGQLGLYGGWKQDSFHLEALAEGGINSYTTQREALGGTASGNAQGQVYSGLLGAGYDWKVDHLTVGPFVTGQYTSVNLNSFTETGSLAPLSLPAQSAGYWSSDLGASAHRNWDMGGWSLSPSLSAAWEHIYQGNLDSLNANFGGSGNFTVTGPAMGTDAAVLAAGLNAQFAKGFGAYAQYQGKVGLTNYTEQNVSGGVNLGF